MKKPVLAILDEDKNYAVRFMEQVNRRKTMPYTVHAFTDTEELKTYLRRNYAEVLLISENMKPAKCDYGRNRIVILTNGPGNTQSDYPSVSRYQATSAMIREISMICSSDTAGRGGKTGILKKDLRIFGVFSPIAGCGKTVFALALGQTLAAHRAVLYLNFDFCPGLRHLAGEEAAPLEELLYYVRREDPDLTGRLSPLVHEIGNMSYLPPCRDTGEPASVTPEEWHALFEAIRASSVYEALVLDFGQLPFLCPELLCECDRIFMPVLQNAACLRKMKELGSFLEERSVSLSEAVREITLPGEPGPDLQIRTIQQLPYTPWGKLAAELLKEEGV